MKRKKDINIQTCPQCGFNKWETVVKKEVVRCRSCGKVLGKVKCLMNGEHYDEGCLDKAIDKYLEKESDKNG